MNEVLTMCAKLTEDYSELKRKLKDQEELQAKNIELQHQCSNLSQ